MTPDRSTIIRNGGDEVRRHERVLVRDVPGGAIAARWDHDEPGLELNASARSILEAATTWTTVAAIVALLTADEPALAADARALVDQTVDRLGVAGFLERR